ncbi:MAG: DUF4258 domain-containing protein [Deltaproteobacteria bacterium]|nr:DUF4258 domain-containing protein [Deltaproteobacteria bacterium]
MSATEGGDVLQGVRGLVMAEAVRVTLHANEEMVEEGISLDEVLEAITVGSVLEDYPDHKRGACCLIGGNTRNGRHIHVVCTTAEPVLVIITVYEPKQPKWVTPTRRRR